MANLRWLLLGVTLTALAAGGVAWLAGSPTVSDYCWIAGTVAAIIPATWWVIAGLRAGRFRVDVLAVLSLVGSLAVREYLAGALIAVMLATGGRWTPPPNGAPPGSARCWTGAAHCAAPHGRWGRDDRPRRHRRRRRGGRRPR